MTLNFNEPELHIGNAGTPPIQFYKQGLKIGGSGTTPTYQDIVLSGNGSLTLTNAKANGLNYLKLFGGTEQSNLPKGYTQYEYLRSSGTQYIDLGYKGNGNTKVKIKFRYHTATSATGSGRVFGSRQSSTNNAFAVGTSSGVVASTGNKVFWCYDGQSFYVSDNTFASDEWQTVVFSATEHKINGETEGDDYTVTTFETPSNLMLFAFDNNGTIGCGYVDIAYCKLWDDDGTLVRDLIPAGNGTTYSMYDRVSKSMLPNAGTGTFEVGNATVPTPDHPIDIVCNNGVLKYGNVSKNLFDEDYGELGSSFVYKPLYLGVGTYTCSYSLPHDENGTSMVYFLNGNVSGGASNRQNQVDASTPRTITTSTGYVTLAYRKGSSIGLTDKVPSDYDCMIEQGSRATTYEPYRLDVYTDGATEKVEVHTKNLFDEQWNRNTGTSTSQATWGQVASANGWSTSSLIPVKEGQQYTVSYNTTVQIYVFYYESDGTMQQSYDTVSATKKTFTVPSGAVNVRLQVNKSTESAIAALETQLELGSTATTYEPYFDGGTATAEMLLKLGNYQDVQSILDGVVTRNVGIKVLDGTESWSYAASYSRFVTNVPDMPIIASRTLPFISTHYQVIHGPTTNPGYIYNSSNGQIMITDAHTSVEDWTQWLADQYNSGNPVVIVYPLSTATTESVDGQELTIQAGTNIVEITQASINNLPLEVSYKGTV